MIDTTALSYASFDDRKRIASGSLPVNALAVKCAIESGVLEPLLTFCDRTGLVQGSDAEMLARLPPGVCPHQENKSAMSGSVESGEPRGRGRPKLGGVAQEVTLLPLTVSNVRSKSFDFYCFFTQIKKAKRLKNLAFFIAFFTNNQLRALMAANISDTTYASFKFD